jgi:hypothetical protein
MSIIKIKVFLNSRHMNNDKSHPFSEFVVTLVKKMGPNSIDYFIISKFSAKIHVTSKSYLYLLLLYASF